MLRPGILYTTTSIYLYTKYEISYTCTSYIHNTGWYVTTSIGRNAVLSKKSRPPVGGPVRDQQAPPSPLRIHSRRTSCPAFIPNFKFYNLDRVHSCCCCPIELFSKIKYIVGGFPARIRRHRIVCLRKGSSVDLPRPRRSPANDCRTIHNSKTSIRRKTGRQQKLPHTNNTPYSIKK